MEEIELSQEQRDFTSAAQKLAARIRESSKRLGYDLAAACTLVENGNLTVHVGLPDDPAGFICLPVEVGLFLTANACGGLFPQAPVQK